MQRKKVLIIDDNVSQLDLIEILFENQGFDVEQAISGEVALNKINNEDLQPDAIVVDLMMPNMSGSETTRAIREAGIECPVIAFTAVDDSDLHQEALVAGCNLILTKPCKPDILLNEISKIIAKDKMN